MRLSLTIAIGLALTASQPAGATKLSGKSFKIDKETSNAFVVPYPFATGGTNFGVAFDENTDSYEPSDTISLKLFKAKGKPDGKKVTISKAEPGPVSLAITRMAGVFELSKDRQLIGYFDSRPSGEGVTGGLFAQIVKDGKPVGDELVIDPEKTHFVYDATITPLRSRALATWTYFNRSTEVPDGENVTIGRFVSSNGKLGEPNINVSRDGDLMGITPFGKGFIATWRDYDLESEATVYYARIYDGNGKPGPDKLISPDGKPRGPVIAKAIALDDDTILVLNRTATTADGEIGLIAQLYNGNWSPIGSPKAVAKSLFDGAYAVQALGDGEFILSSRVKDGDASAIAFTRFTRKLKQVGGSARVAINGANIIRMLPLDTGDVMALYSVFGGKLTGQLIKP